MKPWLRRSLRGLEHEGRQIQPIWLLGQPKHLDADHCFSLAVVQDHAWRDLLGLDDFRASSSKLRASASLSKLSFIVAVAFVEQRTQPPGWRCGA